MEASKTTDGPEQTLTLHGHGDKELYYAQAQDNSWSLPMFVEWKHDKEHDRHYALVNPAVSLYTNQSLMMQALLQPHDVMGEKTRWLIPRNICEAVLHKAQGITPVFYYKWPDDAQPPLPAASFGSLRIGKKDGTDPKAVLEGLPFIRHVATRLGLPGSTVGLVYKAICQEAPRWMLETKSPLELGFCTLAAFPFRPNWKEIVAYKCRKWKLRSLLHKAETIRDDAQLKARLEELGMPSVMCSPHNIGMMNRGHITYTLEAIPTKRFHGLVTEIENQRLSCGWNSYVAHYEESVERYYFLMVKALGNYVKKAAASFARVLAGGNSGVIRFLPIGGKQTKVHGVALNDIPVHIVAAGGGFSVLGTSSDPRLVQEKTDAMQKVSTVPPETLDLWRREKHADMVGKRRDGRLAQAAGMLVQHGTQSQAEGQPMLPEPTPYDRDESGLD